MKMTQILCAGVVASVAVTSANAATLLGDEVDVNLDGAILLEDLDVLVTTGIELEGGNAATNFGAFLFPLEFIDITDNGVSMAFDLPLGENGMLTFSDLDFGAGIGGVSINSTIPSVQAAQVSFTANSVTLDLTDWFFDGGAGTIDLTFTEVPAPGAAALAGVAGLAAIRRRR